METFILGGNWVCYRKKIARQKQQFRDKLHVKKS